MLTLLLNLLSCMELVMSMKAETVDLVTPDRRTGEACGYDSCGAPVEGKINVHLVPHTHIELGVVGTFHQHFTGIQESFVTTTVNAKRIFDAVITELWEDKERTFTLSDTPYFFHWWSQRDGTVRRMVYQLLRQGRLFFVGGGWGMNDEACTSYHAIIDSFTYSLRKLNATFLGCGLPAVAWQADVAGHSREFASLVALMGFDAMFLGHISFDDEVARMQRQALELLWRGSDDLGTASDVFAHKLFDNYWPPPGFCFAQECNDPLLVTSSALLNNLKERVDEFLDLMVFRQAPHYNTTHLMVVMGKRDGYHDAGMWFRNIDKLIGFGNERSSQTKKNIHLMYSTPACYLKAVREANPVLETKQDDFYPYAYDRHSYFTGSYTSRPNIKLLAREGLTYLHTAKQLQVFANMSYNVKTVENMNWIVGVFQDHNVIAGYMRAYVVEDYVLRMSIEMQKTILLYRDAFNKLRGSRRGTVYDTCMYNASSCGMADFNKILIVVYNPLAWPVTLPVRLPIRGRLYNVFNPEGDIIKSTRMKIPDHVLEIPLRDSVATHELVFLAEDLPPLGYRTYYLEKLLNRRKRSIIKKIKKKKSKKYLIRQTPSKIEDGSLLTDMDQDYEYFDEDYKDKETTEEPKTKIISDTTTRETLQTPVDLDELSTKEFYTEGNIEANTVLTDIGRRTTVSSEENSDINTTTEAAVEDNTTTRTEKAAERNTTIETTEVAKEESATIGITQDEEGKESSNVEVTQDNANQDDTNIQRNSDELEGENTSGMDKVNNEGEESNKYTHIQRINKTNKDIRIGKKYTSNEYLNNERTQDQSSIDNSNIEKNTVANEEKVDSKENTGDSEISSNSTLYNQTENDELNLEKLIPVETFPNTNEKPLTVKTEDENNDVKNATDYFSVEQELKNESARKSFDYVDSKDLFIENKYIRVNLDPSSRKVSSVNLSNGVNISLDIQFFYYVSDEPKKMGREDERQPGIYIFRSMDNEPVPILDFVDTQVYKSPVVQEIHSSYSAYASFSLRLYADRPVIEVNWLVGPIPDKDGYGKDVYVRYLSDLETEGVFYTDSNGRQTVKRIRNLRPMYVAVNKDPVAGNFYPVTSKIYIEDLNRNIRLSVFNDRAQGGSSLYDGEIDLMVQRLIYTEDSGRIQAILNDTVDGKGLMVRGKHHLYVSKANYKPNKIFEKKLAKELELMPYPLVTPSLVFGKNTKEIWEKQKNELSFLTKKMPLGIHLLTLEKWNDGTILLRLENYLEKSDAIKSGIKQVFIKDLFKNIRINSVRETMLAGHIWLDEYEPRTWSKKEEFIKNFNDFYASGKNPEYSDDERKPFEEVKLDEGITLIPQQIRTFVCWFDYV